MTVRGQEFFLDGQPYRYVGANYWYAMNLGSLGPGGDRARLVRELDRLQELGLTNLRILAASEGPDDAPYRVVPSLQKSPGVYDEELLSGLDFALAEMGKRGMKAVLMLGNFWEWTGGFAQLVQWTRGGEIPYFQTGGNFQNYSDNFYGSREARDLYLAHAEKMLNRVNSVTGIPYNQDPAIMSWQLSNEPRGNGDPEGYLDWVKEASAFIKKRAPDQLVSLGSEGRTAYPSSSNNLWDLVHGIPTLDYATVHIWVYNWGWFEPRGGRGSLDLGQRAAVGYLEDHLKLAKKFKKPVVLEEFGIPRDEKNLSPGAPVTLRDQYFQGIFQAALGLSKEGLQGLNIWSWAGEGRPSSTINPQGDWKTGDPWTGDPPQEPQGLNSVFDSDASTLEILSRYSAQMRNLR